MAGRIQAMYAWKYRANLTLDQHHTASGVVGTAASGLCCL
jgi:hypothetical protein